MHGNHGKTALIYSIITIYLGLRPRIKNYRLRTTFLTIYDFTSFSYFWLSKKSLLQLLRANQQIFQDVFVLKWVSFLVYSYKIVTWGKSLLFKNINFAMLIKTLFNKSWNGSSPWPSLTWQNSSLDLTTNLKIHLRHFMNLVKTLTWALALSTISFKTDNSLL